MLQVLFIGLLDDKITFPPAQNELGPLAVIVGVSGIGVTEIAIDVVGELQPLAPCVDKEYVPLELTIIEDVISPVLQLLFVALDEVSVADCPAQIELPVLVIVGVTGFGKTVTLKFDEFTEHAPLPEVTE